MTINQLPIDPYDPARADKWGYTDADLRRCMPGLFPPANAVVLTRYRWRRLDPQLRRELRQVLGPQAGILNRPVLDVARELCARDAYLLAWHLYQGLDGQPFTPYQGCGLGLTMDRRRCMGEDGEPFTYGSEETPLLIRTRHRSGEARP